MYRPLSHGATLVWKHQRLLWWIGFVNFALAWLASISPRSLFGFALNRSLLSSDFVQRFDIGTFVALILRPGVDVRPLVGGSIAFSIVFLIYVLFISGGVLEVYREDRRLGRGEFFRQAGEYFWRMVRLMLFSIVPFGIVLGLLSGVNALGDKVSETANTATPEHRVLVVGGFICLLLGLWVRAWFDLAQTRTVCDQERGMFFLTFRSLALATRRSIRFIAMYLGITLVGAAVVVVAFLIWLNIPHAHFGLSWILLEAVSLTMIGMRLWQRAAMMVWYTNYARVNLAPPAFVQAVIPPLTGTAPSEPQPATAPEVQSGVSPEETKPEVPTTPPPV